MPTPVRFTLSKGEELLLSVFRKRPRFGAEVRCIMEHHTGEACGDSALYPLLRRLNTKGFIAPVSPSSVLENYEGWRTHPSEAIAPEGRPRKYYAITEEGLKQLNAGVQLRDNLSDSLRINYNISGERGKYYQVRCGWCRGEQSISAAPWQRKRKGIEGSGRHCRYCRHFMPWEGS